MSQNMEWEFCTLKFDNEGVNTRTSTAEIYNEEDAEMNRLNGRQLNPSKTIQYCRAFIQAQSARGMSSEVFFPWNPTYVLLPLRLMGHAGTEEFQQWCEKFTKSYEHRKGDGYISGFPQDHIHTVTQYATIMGIALIGTEDAYNLIDRPALYRQLMRLKLPNGAFRTTIDMEHDVRSTFAALMIAQSVNIMTDDLIEGVAEFAASCQGYDGGIAPRPGLESHGGYVHCAVGILHILGKLDMLDLPALVRWISMRQMDYTGGFNGRPNKLVDSCYSWWIGTACKILSEHLHIPPFWNERAMADYILRISQQQNGGFCDHAPSGADPFHTMYALGGLCVCGGRETGRDDMELPELDTIMCCPKDLADKMRDFFAQKPPVN